MSRRVHVVATCGCVYCVAERRQPVGVHQRVVRVGSWNWQVTDPSGDLGETTGTRYLTKRGAADALRWAN